MVTWGVDLAVAAVCCLAMAIVIACSICFVLCASDPSSCAVFAAILVLAQELHGMPILAVRWRLSYHMCGNLRLYCACTTILCDGSVIWGSAGLCGDSSRVATLTVQAGFHLWRRTRPAV